MALPAAPPLPYDWVMGASLELLDVYFDELSPNRAGIGARLAAGDVLGGYSIVGQVRGPRCSRGSTLPATYRLTNQSNEQALRASAIITEPVFWSPDWPALYDVTVELRRGSAVIDQTTRTIGLRPLGIAGSNLTYAGKTWVLRGVHRLSSLAEALEECARHSAALVAPVELIDWGMLSDASEKGVLTVVLLTASETEEEIRLCSQYAAAAIGVLPPKYAPSRRIPSGNLLLAHHVRQGDEEPAADAAWLILGEVLEEATFASWAATLKRPVIAYRELWEPPDVGPARAECDRLQRDLAPYGQFAGYIV